MADKKSLVEIVHIILEMAPDMSPETVNEAIDVAAITPGMFTEQEVAEAKAFIKSKAI